MRISVLLFLILPVVACGGDAAGAIEEFSRAIQADPTNALAYECRGIERHQAGALDEAIEDLEQAARLGGGAKFLALALLLRAELRVAELDPDGALRDFERFIEFDPDHDKTPYARRMIATLKIGLIESASQ